jgi:thiol-disulfide isomerase/thioredoxin
MIYITSENELNLNYPVACMYFYATWMPFHKRMATMISKIEEKYKDKIIFYAIDVDFFKAICKRYQLDSIPAIIINFNNKEKFRVNGVIMTSALKSVFVDIFNEKEKS